ncbi:MAG: hypothetical protein HRU70_04395 [Phycisphaeraceae bacterium]|nr:MAG: hypothetical protein HRU70_04395 [Phycisphaeraceae bacterium]
MPERPRSIPAAPSLALSLVLVLAAAFSGAGAPHGQNAQPRAADVQTPTVEDALAQVRRAYTSGPIAERVQARVAMGRGRERRATFTVFADAGAPASGQTPARPPRFKADFGSQLIIAADRDAVTAINRHERTTYFRTEPALPIPRAVAETFRPIPSPHLALVFGDHPRLPEPLPYAPDTVWQTVEPVSDAGRPAWLLKGESRGRPVSITLDRASGRIRRVVANLPAVAEDGSVPADPPTIELTIGVIEPGDPASWAIDTEGRTRVASVSDLVRLRPSINPGDSLRGVPLMLISSPGGEPDLTPVAVESLRDEPGGPGVLVLLVFRDDPDSGVTGDELAEVADLAAGVLAKGETRLGTLAPVALGTGTDLDLSRLARWSSSWGVLRDRLGPVLSSSTFLGTSRALSVEVQGRPARRALIVLNAESSVVGVVVLDDRLVDASADLSRLIVDR